MILLGVEMIGVILATYADYGKELLKVSELIVGEKDLVSSISINPQNEEAGLTDVLKKTIADADKGNGVIALIDIYASPHSKALLVLKETFCEKLEIISGVNLPMLITAHKGILTGETDLISFVKLIKDHTIQSIFTSSQML